MADLCVGHIHVISMTSSTLHPRTIPTLTWLGKKKRKKEKLVTDIDGGFKRKEDRTGWLSVF